MTYAELKAELQAWAQSSEATFVGTTGVDVCIRNAETTINDKAIIPDARKTTTFATVIGTNIVSVALNVAAPLQIFRTGKRPLIPKPASYMREMFVSNVVGAEPTHYAWIRSTMSAGATTNILLLGPTPDAVYTYNIEYIAGVPDSLVTQTAGTWLSVNRPNVLRKMALYEAAIFLKMNEMIPVYKEEAEAALMSMVSMLGSTATKDEERP